MRAHSLWSLVKSIICQTGSWLISPASQTSFVAFLAWGLYCLDTSLDVTVSEDCFACVVCQCLYQSLLQTVDNVSKPHDLSVDRDQVWTGLVHSRLRKSLSHDIICQVFKLAVLARFYNRMTVFFCLS